MEDPSAPMMKYKVIGLGKPKRVSKGPWESRIGKWPKKHTGLNRLGKREEANPWAVCRKARMGHCRPKVM